MSAEGLLKALGDSLKRARSGKGLSLGAVARAARISPAYVQKLEHGDVKNPSPRVLHRLGEVLGLSYLLLMELAGYPMPAPAQGPGASSGAAAPSGEDLTLEEQKAVAAFIAYLKAQRTAG